jgi:small-conductance mechanosensitive channel
MLAQLLAFLFLLAPAVQASQADEAALVFANREVVVLRATVAGMTPRERVVAARERLSGLDDAGLVRPVSTGRIKLDGERAIPVTVGGLPVFAIVDGDLDPLAEESADAAAMRAARRLAQALAAAHRQRQPEVVVEGSLEALAASAALALALWSIRRVRRGGADWLARAAHGPLGWLAQRGLDLHSAAAAAVRRVAGLAALVLGLACCYLWLTYVLRRFPYTEPWGDALAASLWRQLARLGAGLVGALPGLFTVVLIVVLAWLATRALRFMFRAVEEERMALPFVYADTARPTSWLASGLVWLFALATAYPYIPASETPAFKGISVIAGLMATLGSAGVVNQAMSGLILLYARAVAKGDMVSIGDCEGIVTAVDLLSTKVRNYRNEEVTLPNTLVLAAEITNHTRLAARSGATVSTTVPVGYDKSWRQVAALLQEAARQTEGVRHELPARVLQRELTAFHVSYELVAVIEDPVRRPFVLDALLGNIQDQFNRYGVQIMTPNFQDQPEEKVIVPAERWYAAPAAPPAAPPHPNWREHGNA